MRLEIFCERIRAVAVANSPLHLTACIRQAASRKFQRIIIKKTETFLVDLKTPLGLILLNQYCHVVARES